jgi:hypothetical protein
VDTDPANPRPTSRRPFVFRGLVDAPFLALLVIAAAALVAFAWHPGLATLGDDSVSYLIQAQVYAGTAPDVVRQWLGHETQFPPLFPLLLAATGAAHDYLRAHIVVAACSVAALIAIRAFALAHVRPLFATLLVVALLLTPAPWLNELGILSEPLYIALTFAALAWHARAQALPTMRERVVLGVVIGLALITRTAAVALVAAYGAWAGLRAWGGEERRAALAAPLAIPLAFLALWLILRPAVAGENYGSVLRNDWLTLTDRPGHYFSQCAEFFARGWIADFTSESHVAAVTGAIVLAVLALALAGAVRAARANRLDGWYALAYAAMIFLWQFPEESSRRLLYPLLPLALLHAGETAFALSARVAPKRPAWGAGLAAALVALMTLPAVALIATKSLDRVRPYPDSPLTYAAMLDYYVIIPVGPARIYAARNIAVESGLVDLARLTPPGANVMWMRPDYVAVLSGRPGVPWYYADGVEGAVAQLRATGTRYIVVSSIYKADMRGDSLDPVVTAQAVAPFTRLAYLRRNALIAQDEFALLEVDPAALEAYAATLATPRR